MKDVQRHWLSAHIQQEEIGESRRCRRIVAQLLAEPPSFLRERIGYGFLEQVIDGNPALWSS
jgi:hypothetical protein